MKLRHPQHHIVDSNDGDGDVGATINGLSRRCIAFNRALISRRFAGSLFAQRALRVCDALIERNAKKSKISAGWTQYRDSNL